MPRASSQAAMEAITCALEQVPQMRDRCAGMAAIFLPFIASVKKRLYSMMANFTFVTLPSSTTTSIEASPSTLVMWSSRRSMRCMRIF